jgi:peptidylprolyl isomerase
MTSIRSATLPCAAAIALALLAAGCGSSSSGSSADKAIQAAPSGTVSATPATTPTATTPTATTPANPALAKKPKIAAGTGPPPKKLIVRDLVKGTGPAVVAGEMLTVQYVGVLYKNGKQFDASWDGGSPFPFTVGVGAVIPGWDQGLIGMHVGGRRQLVIPSALAYGKQARPGVPPNVGIPANSALIFDVDLLSAQPPA